MNDAKDPAADTRENLTRFGLALLLERTPHEVLAETTCGSRKIRVLGPSGDVRHAIAVLEVEDGSRRARAHLVLDSRLELVVQADDGKPLGRGKFRAPQSEHPCDDCPGNSNWFGGDWKLCLYFSATCRTESGITCCEGEIGGCVGPFAPGDIDVSWCWES